MVKRFLTVLLAAVMLAALLLPLAASADTETYYVYTQNGKGLNVREQPSTDSKAIASLPYGSPVEVVFFNSTGWADILYNGHEYWVMARYLVDSKPAPHKKTPEEEKQEEEKNEQKKLADEISSERAVDPSFMILVRTTRTSGWINFRSGPGKLTKRVASFPDGKELQVIGETANWYKALDPTTRNVGYIHKSYTVRVASPIQITPAEEGKKQLGVLNVNGAFNLQCSVPDGFTLQVVNIRSNSIVASITSADMTKPQLYLSVAFDETYSDVDRMNDMTDEDLAALEDTFRDMNEVEISYRETTYGTKLMVVRETGADTDFVDIVSVYKGYFVEFNMTPNPNAASQVLTDDQIAMCIQFLSDLDFVPAN